MNYNKEQRKAVNHKFGPLLVVAGAGTGKTSVLIGRLANLVLKEKYNLDQIILLTFTEKAAEEMETRVDQIMPYGCFDAQIYTFHGLAEKILRQHALEIGLNADFKLLNTTEQWILIKKNIDKFNLNYYKPLGNPNKFISELIKHFSRLKDENISSNEYTNYVKKEEKRINKKNEAEKIELERNKELALAYKNYNQLLVDSAYLDFGDLINYAIMIFQKRPNILKIWQKKAKFIMLDEFQDTNWAQYKLVKILAEPENNLMVVGDDDQAIYKFRGASLANILQFKDDYPKVKEVLLKENYRSYQEILDKSYLSIINNNPDRLEEKLKINKKLISKVKNTNEKKVVFNLYKTEDEELAQVAEKIKEIYKKKKVKWSDFAILTRSNKSAETFSNNLSRLKIPNHFMSLRGLYRKGIVLDCLAYLRLLNDHNQASSLYRLFNLKPFNITYPDLMIINQLARRKNLSIFKILEDINSIKEIKSESKKNILHLVNLIKKHGELVKVKSVSNIFLSFILESEIIKNLDYDRDQEQFSYLNQFYKKIKKFEESLADAKLADFIETFDLELEAGDSGSLMLDFIDNESVKIMTVHGAKGLEFNYVFLVDLVENKFPSINRKDKIILADDLVKEKIDQEKDVHIQEERRLFYVAMTRAKKKLFLSANLGKNLTREKKVSRFISEIGFDAKDSTISKLDNLELLNDLKNKKDYNLNQKLILPSRFSFSQLAAFDTCPLQYKYAFILKIPVLSNKASLIFGRVMHNVLYEFLSPLLNNRQASLFEKKEDKSEYINWSRLKKIYNSRFINEGYSSKEERDSYYKDGLESLKKIFTNIKKEKLNIVYLEKNFIFRLKNDTIKGAIDRIDKLEDGSLEVIDYKTGEIKEKLEYKDKKQLILYQLFLEKILDVKVAKLTYYYIKEAKKLSFTATLKEKIKLEDEVVRQIEKIKEKNFKAKPSPMCRYCDFKEICPWREI